MRYVFRGALAVGAAAGLLAANPLAASATGLPPVPDPINQLLTPAPSPAPSQPGTASASSSGLSAGGPGACGSCSSSSASQSGSSSGSGTSVTGTSVSGGSASGNQSDSGSLQSQDLNGAGSVAIGRWTASSSSDADGASSSADSSLVDLSVPGGTVRILESSSQASSNSTAVESSSQSALLAGDFGDVTVTVLQAQASGTGSSSASLVAIGNTAIGNQPITIGDPTIAIPGLVIVTALAQGFGWADGVSLSQVLGSDGTLLDLSRADASVPAIEPVSSNQPPTGGVLGVSASGISPGIPLTGFVRLWPIWAGLALLAIGGYGVRRASAKA